MLKQIAIIIKLVKDMGEIPGVLFVGAGMVVGGVSFFLAIIKGVERPTFFYLMMGVAAGFIVYGMWKTRKKKQKHDALLHEKRQKMVQRDPYTEIEVKPQHRGGPFSSSTAGQHPGHHTVQNTMQSNQQVHPQHLAHQRAHHPASTHPQQAQHHKRFCPNCGAAIQGHHRFCASCGTKL